MTPASNAARGADDLVPVMLAGGSGTRLWPVSRELWPKHLATLTGELSLLQLTARRLLAVAPPERILTVGARAQGPMVRAQLQTVDPALGARMILEPAARNTAAAVALAALDIRDRLGPASVLWICPSDHLVGDEAALRAALAVALPAARAGMLVTFGITPGRPEPGYGYIQAGEPVADHDGVLHATRFVEKPPLETCRAMLLEGGHLWNSGMFLFRADRLLEELAAHAPDIARAASRAYDAAQPIEGALIPPLELFAAVPSAPIDKAVMERSDEVAVVPCDPGWSDVGSWQALWERSEHDADDNAVEGDVLLRDSGGCLVHAGHRLVACAGVRDLAVVETRDAVLVADRRAGDAIRGLVEALKGADRPEARQHAGEVRPWGAFTVLHEGPGFKVKEIVVSPGAILSLQSHRHRAEHWVVVQGTARVQVEDEIRDLGPDESVHIPLGAKHRMSNPGEVPMRLIEVQCGAYTGEDDIIRYEDAYGRS